MNLDRPARRSRGRWQQTWDREYGPLSSALGEFVAWKNCSAPARPMPGGCKIHPVPGDPREDHHSVVFRSRSAGAQGLKDPAEPLGRSDGG